MTETTQCTTAVDSLRARAHWYRLLAGVFAEEPQAAFVRELRTEACRGALAELGVAFGDDFLRTDEATLLETLACEYTMLFVAPGGFPPMESVRLEGGLRQGAAIRAHACYASEGLAVEAGRFAGFDDHLAVELEFVAALLERQAEALEGNDGQEARRLEKASKRFWVKHLGRWVRGYAGLVEEASEHSFFREMARLLAAFAESELELLGLDVDDGDGGRWRAPKPPEATRPVQCGGAGA
ncbi:MAG: molecular chaperone TorD family protein [Gemmatimonadetes bacterium]|nr:molecular chaperone TorD family protein [Gemmatimonadota bacterium]NIR82698.1 molecular chaperone TorD family protein [Gammaproteobacteria bacterium]